jgi:hypothetical protein
VAETPSQNPGWEEELAIAWTKASLSSAGHVLDLTQASSQVLLAVRPHQQALCFSEGLEPLGISVFSRPLQIGTAATAASLMQVFQASTAAGLGAVIDWAETTERVVMAEAAIMVEKCIFWIGV